MTDATRTLLDLGLHVPPETLEAALDSALRRRATSLPRLRWRLALMGTSGRPGPAALARLLKERGVRAPAESPLEVRMRRLLRHPSLPSVCSQHEIREGGRVVARVDFAYPEERLAIEVDGYAFHHGRARWQSDLARRTVLARLGWRVMHFTSTDLADGAAIVDAVRTALDQRR